MCDQYSNQMFVARCYEEPGDFRMTTYDKRNGTLTVRIRHRAEHFGFVIAIRSGLVINRFDPTENHPTPKAANEEYACCDGPVTKAWGFYWYGLDSVRRAWETLRGRRPVGGWQGCGCFVRLKRLRLGWKRAGEDIARYKKGVRRRGD